MRKRLVNTLALVAGLAASVSTASAQVTTGRLYELGIDGGIEFGLNKPRTTTIGIPAQSMRVGIFMNPKWSLEPSFGVQSTSGGGSRVTMYAARLGALYHLSARPTRTGAGWYVRPFVGLVGFDSDASDSDTRAVLGAGYGYKHQLSDRFAARFEGNYSHMFAAGGSDANNVIGLTFGLSFFTR
jgi:hypothetical protein